MADFSTTTNNQAVFRPKDYNILSKREFELALSGNPKLMADELYGLLTHDQLSHIKQLVLSSKTICPFLRIPIEVRNMIYAYLLVNPELAKPPRYSDYMYDESLPIGMEFVPAFGAIRYGLQPNLLLVSRQTNAEGIPILYGKNKFYIDCSGESAIRKSWPQDDLPLHDTPLTRYLETDHSYACFQEPSDRYSLSAIPAIKHIQHWKIILSSLDYKASNTMRRQRRQPQQQARQAREATLSRNATAFIVPTKLEQFCRAICVHRPKSLEFLVIVNGLCSCNGPYLDLDTDGPASLLYPLNYIRNLERLTFGDAIDEDLLRERDAHKDRVRVLQSLLPSITTQLRLSSMTQSDAKDCPSAEKLWLQYKALVKYAQAFECISTIRDWMHLPREVTPEFLEIFGTLPGQFGRIRSPIIWPTSHPVENALTEARKAADRKDVDKFWEFRRIVIDLLEAKYYNIVSTGFTLNNFIKSEKMYHGKLNYYIPKAKSTKDLYPAFMPRENSLDPDFAIKCIVMLEDYINSFIEETTTKARVAIKERGDFYSKLLHELPQFSLLREMNAYYEVSISPKTNGPSVFEEFIVSFRSAVDECDEQYLQIRQTKKALFEWDNVKDSTEQARKFATDIGMGGCDEMVQWHVSEPAIGPLLEADAVDFMHQGPEEIHDLTDG